MYGLSAGTKKVAVSGGSTIFYKIYSISSYKGCNFTPVVKAACRVNIGKLFCMCNVKKKMIEVQLKRSMHIAQMRIFLWQRTVMVFVPSFGHSDN